jgi:Tfp pilus assembly protein PilF
MMILLGISRRTCRVPDPGRAERSGKARAGGTACTALFGLAVATYAAAYSATDARESSAFVKDAEQYFASGNLEAAEIELKNAVRQSPKDPAIHLRLAEVYLRLGNAASAEREARAARELNADAGHWPLWRRTA